MKCTPLLSTLPFYTCHGHVFGVLRTFPFTVKEISDCKRRQLSFVLNCSIAYLKQIGEAFRRCCTHYSSSQSFCTHYSILVHGRCSTHYSVHIILNYSKNLGPFSLGKQMVFSFPFTNLKIETVS